MPLFLRLLLAVLPFVWQVDPKADPDPKDPKVDPPKPRFEWTEEQQAEIRRIATKEARAAAEKARKDRDAEIEQERKDREAEQQRKKNEEAGMFAEVRTALEGERDTAKTDLQAANAELDTLRDYVTSDIETVTKAVKESESAKVLMDFHPGDEASTPELLTWAQKAKARLPELASTRRSAPGNPANPPPRNTDRIDEDAARAQSRRNVRI